ncbi:hypothetical protein FB451DRAFT_1248746, partial [Mycena latifolia]
ALSGYCPTCMLPLLMTCSEALFAMPMWSNLASVEDDIARTSVRSSPMKSNRTNRAASHLGLFSSIKPSFGITGTTLATGDTIS